MLLFYDIPVPLILKEFQSGKQSSNIKCLYLTYSPRFLSEILPPQGRSLPHMCAGSKGAGVPSPVSRVAPVSLLQTSLTSLPMRLALLSPFSSLYCRQPSSQCSTKPWRGISLSPDKPLGAVWDSTWEASCGLQLASMYPWKLADAWYRFHRSPGWVFCAFFVLFFSSSITTPPPPGFVFWPGNVTHSPGSIAQHT